jgi:hypothetical protein
MAVATPDAERSLGSVESGDCREIVLDPRRLSFLDSTGINLLISAHARALSILPTKAAA